jgi:hypothetical protein
VPHRLYSAVAGRARYRREYCRAPERAFNFEFEGEHIIPRAAEGSDEPSNLALACRACDLRKGASERARDPATGEMSRLFNPRTDSWAVHFQVNARTFRIEGLTAMGRASVQRLGMNRPHALRARRIWLTRLLERF